MTMKNGTATPYQFGYKIDGGGSVEALTQPAHHGRAVGRTVWIGSVGRTGRRWSAWDRSGALLGLYSTQDAAGAAIYEAVQS